MLSAVSSHPLSAQTRHCVQRHLDLLYTTSVQGRVKSEVAPESIKNLNKENARRPGTVDGLDGGRCSVHGVVGR